MTPFMAPHLFVLMLIIRAVRGRGARLACLRKKNSPASGRVSSAKGEIAKRRKEGEEKKSQQPLDGLCLSQGQNIPPTVPDTEREGNISIRKEPQKRQQGRNPSMLGEKYRTLC